MSNMSQTAFVGIMAAVEDANSGRVLLPAPTTVTTTAITAEPILDVVGNRAQAMESDYNTHDLLVQWLAAIGNGSSNINSTGYDSGELNFNYPLSLLVPTTICYVIIFIAGILGNVVTCIIINKNKSMHTATNYYLFNLAISDLLLLISGMPLDIYNMWIPGQYPFGSEVCMALGMVSETTANATVLTITSFTVERYIAICHPFRQHMMDLNRAVKFIFAIWVVSFCLAIPQFIQIGVVEDHGIATCTIKNKLIDHTFELSSFVFFVGPMIVICALYILIGLKLHRSKLLHGGVKRKGCSDASNKGVGNSTGAAGGSASGGNSSGGNSSGQARVIRMLVAVVVAFFLCWCPFHAQRLMAVNSTDIPSQWKIYVILNQFSGILYFLSTCINPLLYNIMSHKFRDAFKTTIARQFYIGRHKPTEKHNYSVISRRGGEPRLGKQQQPNHYHQHRVSLLRTPQLGHSDGPRSSPPNDNRLSLIENNSREYPAEEPMASSDERTRENVGRIVEASYHENGDINAVRYCEAAGSDHRTATKINILPGRMTTRTDMAATNKGREKRPVAAVKKKGNLLSCFPHTKKTIFYFKSPKKQSPATFPDDIMPFSSAAAAAAAAAAARGGSRPTTAHRVLRKFDSVDSANTISNSSLQEVDEDEFNSSDLVKYMDEINQGIKS